MFRRSTAVRLRTPPVTDSWYCQPSCDDAGAVVCLDSVLASKKGSIYTKNLRGVQWPVLSIYPEIYDTENIGFLRGSVYLSVLHPIPEECDSFTSAESSSISSPAMLSPAYSSDIESPNSEKKSAQRSKIRSNACQRSKLRNNASRRQRRWSITALSRSYVRLMARFGETRALEYLGAPANGPAFL
ncbi:hypothetical protein KP509_25G031400 [Ceratopteris richardii]|uniref:Uncharacterized protein n=1 Tax=Ceratopteris richardii TaxID=49495 RepID=A0A8T2RQF4_CERRI|nr:hypothetical protein KP509_25G031400 [Ceratopteris richardii]